MGRWDDIEEAKEVEELVKVAIDGAFACSICNEPVGTAIYLPNEKILTWKCGTGHISSIEDVLL